MMTAESNFWLLFLLVSSGWGLKKKKKRKKVQGYGEAKCLRGKGEEPKGQVKGEYQ